MSFELVKELVDENLRTSLDSPGIMYHEITSCGVDTQSECVRRCTAEITQFGPL